MVHGHLDEILGEGGLRYVWSDWFDHLDPIGAASLPFEFIMLYNMLCFTEVVSPLFMVC